MELTEEILERLELVHLGIKNIELEEKMEEAFKDFFQKEVEIIKIRLDWIEQMKRDSFPSFLYEEWKKWNKDFYFDLSKECYKDSYVNPSFAVEKLGEEVGREFSHLAYLIQNGVLDLFKGRFLRFVEVVELFLEIYGIVVGKEGKNAITSALYYFKRDNLYEFLKDGVEDNFIFKEDRIYNMVVEDELSPNILYQYGCYVNEDDERVSEYLMSLEQHKIEEMAKTFVDGFFEGYKTMGREIGNKKTVLLYYHIGFERLVREQIKQFKERGLSSILHFENEGANRQAEYDHKNDYGLYMDEKYIHHYLDAYEKVLSEYAEELSVYAGPAAMETFGEPEFQPESKKEAVELSAEVRKLYTSLAGKKYQMFNKYSPADERSFSIISYPLPNISEKRFEEIFDDIIRVNTMDSKEYRKIQQYLIDALDQGEFVHVKGLGENETDIRVSLHELKNPEKETNFENCVADVNIPVGEVFTSPKLEGTNGVLHVTKVFLNGLLYKNLRLTFQEGKITDYSVENFETEEENKKFIRENLLHHHETLPLGEFAIGTNTLAYMVGIKYDIGGKLPILIAEKTGPHFAVGDTCYAMQEDHALFNPDGKEIIARENECSKLRHTDIEKAYFNCHTDITIPYDELGEITVHGKNGEEITLIRNGRFVLEGTESLNKALDE